MFGKGRDEQDVVSMTERERKRRYAQVKAVETYWQSLRSYGAVPLRSNVDPRGMEEALEYAFLGERIAKSMAKIRVAGSHMSDLMGLQMAGMPISSLISPADRERFGVAMTSLFADPAILRLSLKAEEGFGKGAMEGEMVLLPLRSDFGDVTRCLGALMTQGRIGRTPRRFALTSVEIERLDLARVDSKPEAKQRTPIMRGPKANKTNAPMRSNAEARPKLKLVVSND